MATLSEMTNEVVARGYDYLSQTRIETYLNRAHQLLSTRYQWPWLESMAEKVAPIGIGDLRYVLSVTDGTQGITLDGQDRRWLVEAYPNDPSLEEEGSPLYWYLTDKILRVYPTSTAIEIFVHYVKRPETLTPAASPSIPTEYQYLLVEMAVVQCLRDNDAYDVAAELKASIEEDVRAMVSDQLQKNWQQAPLVQRTGRRGDYL